MKSNENKSKLEEIRFFKNKDEISFADFSVLQRFSEDADPAIRSEVTPLMERFLNGKAKDVLLKLAQDEDDLVRLSAYRSLSYFIYDEIECYLKKSIIRENNEFARCYAIAAWADVALSLGHNTSENRRFLSEQKSKEKDDNCLLGYSYAQYQFGDDDALDVVLSYLKHQNPDTRYVVLAILRPDRRKMESMEKAVKLLLEVERDVWIKEHAITFLSDLEELRKFDLFDRFDQLESISDEYLPLLCELSNDVSTVIRCKVAAFLVNYVNDESKALLLRLAQDKYASVRMNAYDSLCCFPYENVEFFLKEAIQTEKDELARYYAIMSWADVAMSLNHNLAENKEFVIALKSVEKDDHCLLGCSYARYIFGDQGVLSEILSYLKHEKYYMRSSALNLLIEVSTEGDFEEIKKAIANMLKTEYSAEVREAAVEVLENYPYDDVEAFLKESISEEKDVIIRSNTICSWADVAASLARNIDKSMDFILKQKGIEEFDNTLLSCSYAQYILGDDDAMAEMISYLRHDDIMIREMALDLLRDVVVIEEENEKTIMKALRSLLDVEETMEINDLARSLLEDITYHTM